MLCDVTEIQCVAEMKTLFQTTRTVWLDELSEGEGGAERYTASTISPLLINFEHTDSVRCTLCQWYTLLDGVDDRVCTVGSVGAGQTTFLVLRGRCGSSIGPDPLADGLRELVCPGTQILKESVCMCVCARSTHAPACGCNESVCPLNIAPHSPFLSYRVGSFVDTPIMSDVTLPL